MSVCLIIDLSKAFVAAGVSGVIAAINPFASFGPKSAKRLNEIRKISNRNPSHSKTGKQARQVAVETVAAATTGTLISTSANIIYLSLIHISEPTRPY